MQLAMLIIQNFPWGELDVTQFLSNYELWQKTIKRINTKILSWYVTTYLINSQYLLIDRSSRLQMFFEIVVVRKSANFTGKHLCWSLFLIIFIKKRLQHRYFPVKFAKLLRTRSFTEHLRWLPVNRIIICRILNNNALWKCWNVRILIKSRENRWRKSNLNFTGKQASLSRRSTILD